MKRFLLAATALTAVSASAFAADLPRRYAAPAPAPYVAVPTFTWTGFYVGANAGGAVDSQITGNTTGPAGSGSASARAGGFLVGGTVGYNYQLSPNFVVGVEGDIGYADIQAKAGLAAGGSSASGRIGVDGYLGTIRGRVGYAMGQWLFYGTGGYAFADGRANLSTVSPFAVSNTSVSRDLQGYVVGGGVEYAINNQLSVKGEYLYFDFDKVRAVTAPNVTTIRQDAHLLKLGVNYKFSAF
jgi:outer membrane immunogenic protein